MAKFDKVIPPGQEGKIEMYVEGKKVHGDFSKSAKVHSNDPSKPVVQIAIAGSEIPYINTLPLGRLFLQGRYGEKVEKEVRLTSNEEDLDFKILGVRSNVDDKITYKVTPGDFKGEYVLKVYKNPKLPTLSTYGSIFVDTNSEKAPEKTIQVQVITKGSITVQPSTINYGRVKFSSNEAEATAVSKSVTILKSKGEFEIRSIKMSSDMYEASIHEMVPGKRYKVEVKFLPPAKTKPRQNEVGEMIIYTNDPTEPQLRVKLVARAM